ncbi:SixA phosphatase family protein [Qingshengfaniella alkalisoli]|uniref:Histidine phosphatase family protein n=1 Tax=Qingshengfaniella alkalisoli TaxID=2599296 RepID=A0A5B8I9U5_9RHOB|nr:histidine phosphatase family protein [Qingshengfaniella alkalisoli]QDY69856.1 histidine phosphatase family protein [Qingshengfaniella alkalisoli]
MRRLILIRHAKSSWSDAMLSDHDRPLNGRGRRAADAIGGWLTDQKAKPDQVLCSTATRTVETWARIAAAMMKPVEPKLLDTLYHASPEDILEKLRAAKGKTVALVGHNPGLAAFASLIVKEAPDHPKFAQYPTGATMIAEFKIDDWTDLKKRSGRVRAFLVPRDLTD